MDQFQFELVVHKTKIPLTLHLSLAEENVCFIFEESFSKKSLLLISYYVEFVFFVNDMVSVGESKHVRVVSENLKAHCQFMKLSIKIM